MVLMSPLPSMPKPATGLPVLAMPSTTRLVQPSSMPMTMHGRDVRVRAGADQGAEMQVEILAELQTAVGVRERERALDVVGDRLAGGVREIVERQDHDVVAHADAAVLAAVAQNGDSNALPLPCAIAAHHRLVLTLWTWTCSPLLDIGDRLADVLAVFPDRVALLDVHERDLVADRDVHLGGQAESRIVMVTTQSMSVPAFRPSTTTTPTVSFVSCTRRCGAPNGTLPRKLPMSATLYRTQDRSPPRRRGMSGLRAPVLTVYRDLDKPRRARLGA